jgi:hypothetical protein
MFFRKQPGHSDRVRIGKPAVSIERPVGSLVNPQRPEFLIGQRVNPKDVQIFSRKSGQSNQALNQGSGCGTAANPLQPGPERIIDRSPRFQICAPRNYINTSGKGTCRAPVRDLDREKYRNPQGNADDIDQSQQFVPGSVSDDVPAKEFHNGLALR